MTKIIKIGIDIRDLGLATTGTKTYLEEMIHALERLASNHVKIIKISSKWPPYWGKSIIGKIYEHLSYLIWKQISLPFKASLNGVDILICTDYYLPLLKFQIKHITVVHDALFFDHPEYYNSFWLKWFNLWCIPALKRSDALIIPSIFSKDRISYHLPYLNEKMYVIHQGPKKKNDISIPSIQTKNFLENLKGRKFILHVGSMEKRKNLPFLIKSLKKIREKHEIELVLVGRINPKINNNTEKEILETIKENDLQNYVHLTGYLPDSDLPMMYRNAFAYVLPSEYEGFGIPILESFQYDLPVIIAKTSSLGEVGGDAVLQYEPNSEKSLVEKIDQLLSNEDLRIHLKMKGRNRLSEFTWDLAGEKIIDLATTLFQN